MRVTRWVLLTCAGALLGPSALLGQEWILDRRGVLRPGSPQTRWGEFYATSMMELNEGERWRFELRSRDFTPFLTLRSPTGREHFGRVVATGPGRSFLEFDVPRGGLWQVVASTVKGGQVGTFQLMGRRLSERTLAGGGPSVERSGGIVRRTTARLAPGGGPAEHEVDVAAGQAMIVSIVSTAFDPMLSASNQRGQTLSSDDWSTLEVSRVAWTAEVDEHWDLEVSSFLKSGAGPYWIEILVADVEEIAGELGPGEIDPVTILIGGDDTVIAELTSEDFDTRLQVVGGAENDDWLCSLSTSRIEFPPGEQREVTLNVGAYLTDGGGSYLVQVLRARSAGDAPAPAIAC